RISKQNRSARAPVNKPVNVRPCPRFGTKRSPAGSPWGPRRSHGGCNVREETRERARSSGRPATPAHERDPCAAIVAQSGARPASGTRPRTQSRDWWHHAGPARPGAAQGQEDRATLVATLGFPARKPALDADAAIQEEVCNAARTLIEAVRNKCAGRLVKAGEPPQAPRARQ